MNPLDRMRRRQQARTDAAVAQLCATIRHTVPESTAELTRRVTELEKASPGCCAECGTPTPSPTVFWCGDEHQKAWHARRTA